MLVFYLFETLKLAKQLPRKLWLLVLSLSKPPRNVGNRTAHIGFVVYRLFKPLAK